MAAATAQALPIVFVALRARLHRGLELWGLGLVVNALSYPAFGLRAFGWAEVSILATNLLSGLTLVLHTLAIASFQRHRAQPVRSALVWLPLAVNMVVVLWFMRDDHWRNILVAGIQSVMAGMLLYQAWGPALVERRLTGRWVLIAGCAGLVLTLVVRTAYMVWASDWDAVYNVPGQVQGLTYFAVMAVLWVNSMGFVLMQMEFALEQLHALATHDSLTGLYNRSALQDLLPALGARARRQGEPLAFLMLDIDHFKRVTTPMATWPETPCCAKWHCAFASGCARAMWSPAMAEKSFWRSCLPPTKPAHCAWQSMCTRPSSRRPCG